MWTDKHGPDELYDKFIVIKNSTGQALKEDEFVFVLRPETDRSAWRALYAYAQSVGHRSPNLAEQIRGKLAHIAMENSKTAAPEPDAKEEKPVPNRLIYEVIRLCELYSEDFMQARVLRDALQRLQLEMERKD